MNDAQIILMYETRDEQAIAETKTKYGHMCREVAERILHNKQDSDECVNDAMLRLWNTIPPQKPRNLAAYVTTIVQNLAYDRRKYHMRLKRSSEQLPLILDELSDCIPSEENVEAHVDQCLLNELLVRFLDALSVEQRTIFVQRYMAYASIHEIALMYRISESKVKISLYRTRKRLKRLLEQEGWL